MNLRDTLFVAGLAVEKGPAYPKTALGCTRVTTGDHQAAVSESEFARVEDYLLHVRIRNFLAVMIDGSLIQVSIDVSPEGISGQCFTFFPCPFDVDRDLWETDDIATIAELYASAGLDSYRLVAPLRFDYAPRDARIGHTASHLHIGHADGRLSCVARIGLHLFARFVLTHFYPHEPATERVLDNLMIDIGDREMLEQDERGLHLGCRHPDSFL